MSDTVVIGGAGWAGMALLRALNAAHVDYCAISHSDAGSDRLRRAGVTRLARADLADPGSLGLVFRAARVVYAIPPALHPREDEYLINAVQAAEDAGVQRFIYHSVLHSGTPFLRNHQRKARVEAALRASRFRWTILQPSMYAQVVAAMFNGKSDSTTKVPFDIDAEISVVDLADCAEVAVGTIVEPDIHDFATYELAGPLTTMRQAITELGHIQGIDLRATTVGVAHGSLPSAIADNPQAAADMISTFAHYDLHGFRGNTFVLTQLLGRAPRTFGEVIAREYQPVAPQRHRSEHARTMGT